MSGYSAFQSNAFQGNGFQIGAQPSTTPTGGWERSFLRPLRWSVDTNKGKIYFNSAEEALAFYKTLNKKKPVKTVKSLGRVFYAGHPVEEFTVKGRNGLDVFKEGDLRFMKMLQAAIERRLMDIRMEEEEMLLMLAAIV